MKNKKGFTLVELLAVIVILGVLLLVAVPAIGNVLTSSRQKAAKDGVIMLIKAAQNYNGLKEAGESGTLDSYYEGKLNSTECTTTDDNCAFMSEPSGDVTTWTFVYVVNGYGVKITDSKLSSAMSKAQGIDTSKLGKEIKTITN